MSITPDEQTDLDVPLWPVLIQPRQAILWAQGTNDEPNAVATRGGKILLLAQGRLPSLTSLIDVDGELMTGLLQQLTDRPQALRKVLSRTTRVDFNAWLARLSADRPDPQAGELLVFLELLDDLAVTIDAGAPATRTGKLAQLYTAVYDGEAHQLLARDAWRGQLAHELGTVLSTLTKHSVVEE